MYSKSRRAHIKQRLFSFEFTFTAHPLLESYILSPTIMWALILWVAPTGECFLSVLDMISSLPFHGCVINPRFFTFIFGEAVSWERLGRGYLHPSSSPSLPVTSYFLKQRLFTSGFCRNAKKRLFTFIFLRLQTTKRLMAFTERKIVLYLTYCNSCCAALMLVPLLFYRNTCVSTNSKLQR